MKNQLGNKICGQHTQPHPGPETLAPELRPVSCMGSITQHDSKSTFSENRMVSPCFFSLQLVSECVLSVTGETPACPTNPLAISFGGHCCACAVPHFALVFALPVQRATACWGACSGPSMQTGSDGNKRKKNMFLGFPSNKKTSLSTWCLLHTVLQLRASFALLKCSICRTRRKNR